MRIGALLVTILLIIGAIVLVVYRDKLNLDSLKRYITYRNLEKNDAGQTTEFNYTQDASNAFASLDGTLLLCSDTALQLYSNSGLLYIDEQVKMSQPVITTCGCIRCLCHWICLALLRYCLRSAFSAYRKEQTENGLPDTSGREARLHVLLGNWFDLPEVEGS